MATPADRQAGRPDETPAMDHGDGWLGRLLAGVLALVALSWALGIVAGSGLFLVGWLRSVGRLPWGISLLAGALLGVLMWLLFVVLLRMSLAAGVLLS